jgi:putative transposase
VHSLTSPNAQRLHRHYGTGHLHFITSSCYARRPLLGTPSRRNLFLQILEQTRLRRSFVVVGYVVMPEHIHLLISEPEQGTPSTITQVLKQRFARRVLGDLRRRGNQSQALLWQEMLDSGHVWQRRFYDFVVRTEIKKIEKLKYIHRNPVSRGLVLEPEEWVWSSFPVVCPRRTRAGTGEPAATGGDEVECEANLRRVKRRDTHPLKTAKGGAASV